MKIHIVEAWFADWESSHTEVIGVFTDEKMANDCRVKYQEFFKIGKELYNQKYGDGAREIELTDDEYDKMNEFESFNDFVDVKIYTLQENVDQLHNKILNSDNDTEKKIYKKLLRKETIKTILE